MQREIDGWEEEGEGENERDGWVRRELFTDSV